MENHNEAKQNVLLRRLYTTLIKYIWLVLLIIIAFAAIGTVISYSQKPIYRTTHKTIFLIKEDGGKNKGTGLTTAYYGTALDYIQQGVVADRADYYYKGFNRLNKSLGNDAITLDEYIDLFKIIDIYEKPEARKFYDLYVSNGKPNLDDFAKIVKIKEVFESSKLSDYIVYFTMFKTKLDTSINVEHKIPSYDDILNVVFDNENVYNEKYDKNEIRNLLYVYEDYYDSVSEKAEIEYFFDNVTLDELLENDRGAYLSYKAYVRGLEKYIDGKGEAFFNSILTFARDVELLYEVEKNVMYTSGNTTKIDISATNVVTGSFAPDSANNFAISVSYIDPIYSASQQKTKLIILAADREAKLNDYFGSWRFILTDLGILYTRNTVSNSKTILTATVIGFLAALVVVYVITLLDRTMTDKDELEELTGVGVLAYISNGGR